MGSVCKKGPTDLAQNFRKCLSCYQTQMCLKDHICVTYLVGSFVYASCTIGEEKIPTACTFFLGWGPVNVWQFLFFKYILGIFQRYFWRKKPVHLDNFYTLYIFWGAFSNPEQFSYFLCSSNQKKCTLLEVSSYKIGPNWPIR